MLTVSWVGEFATSCEYRKGWLAGIHTELPSTPAVCNFLQISLNFQFICFQVRNAEAETESRNGVFCGKGSSEIPPFPFSPSDEMENAAIRQSPKKSDVLIP